jgi:hypothetical protein
MILEDHPRQELLSQISIKSRVLADQLAIFKNLVQDRKVISFYERRQTGRLELVSFYIAAHFLDISLTQSKDSGTQKWRRGSDEFITSVDEESALLQFPDNIEVKIPVDADHSIMVKFDSRVNPIYSSVVKHLKELEMKGSEFVHSKLCK